MRLAQLRLDLGHERLGIGLGEHPVGDELRLVELAHARMLGDLLDHQGLCVRRLVLLVVPEPAVADKVDHDIAGKQAPERRREPDGRDRGLGIVGVDMDDRNLEAFGEVAREER